MPTQLAIAWVKEQGDYIMPSVSMSRRSRLSENIAAMDIVVDQGRNKHLKRYFCDRRYLGWHLFTKVNA